MQEVKFQDPLEEYLAEVLIAVTPAVRRKPRDPSKFSGRFDHRQWADGEANWTRTKGVCLVHQETYSLLGNFSEYRHTRYRDARKLIRELDPIQIDGIEYVSGPQWVPTERVEAELQRSITSTPAILDITLHELGLRSPAVEVRVEILYGNAIQRVELSERTEFHSLDLMRTVWLPKGLDILNGMSFESKLMLHDELELGSNEPLEGSEDASVG